MFGYSKDAFSPQFLSSAYIQVDIGLHDFV